MTNLTMLVSLLLGTPQVQCAGGNLGMLVRDQLFNESVRLDRAADAAWTACLFALRSNCCDDVICFVAVTLEGRNSHCA